MIFQFNLIYIFLILMFLVMFMLILSINIHPLLLMLILMVLIILCSLNLSLYIFNNLFSYLLFLIMIGGLMIIFMYFTSFINNKYMIWSFDKYLFMKMFIFIFMIYNMNLHEMIFMNKYMENFSLFMLMKFKLLNNSMNNYLMYIYPMNLTTLFCLLYLLMVMTLVTSVLKNKKFLIRKLN
nr:NADH dehydrogenase subunit 6 [Sycophaga agraensis]